MDRTAWMGLTGQPTGTLSESSWLSPPRDLAVLVYGKHTIQWNRRFICTHRLDCTNLINFLQKPLMSKNSENKNWRSATHAEFIELLEGLKANHAAIEDSYDYPLEDLLEHLENKGAAACKTMRAEGSETIMHYMLHFQSPGSTWESLCGVEGHYFIDPTTLRAQLFELDSRN